MENQKRSSQQAAEPEISYFELQAYIGTTKHMGGFETTKALIELCHVNQDTYVLEVGCGVGATACYLAKKYGCRVVGVDLRESMIARSNERAQKEGVEEHVEFKVADAQDLPFDDAFFDVVIAESVATFVEDKQRVVNEYARVTSPGGYVGMNEEIWLKPPPTRLLEFVRHTWDIKSNVLTVDGWVVLLEIAELRDVAVKAYELDARRESTQVQRYRFQDMWNMFYRTLLLHVRNPAFREYMAERRHTPKDLFEYLGYAVFVGRKQK
ncbi:MAG: class I SAM-dependent methyltransferase [Chloroflexota bacterium]|nr:class I SAM-dependent methyltransferase [Chloroflexota bacterium]